MDRIAGISYYLDER